MVRNNKYDVKRNDRKKNMKNLVERKRRIGFVKQTRRNGNIMQNRKLKNSDTANALIKAMNINNQVRKLNNTTNSAQMFIEKNQLDARQYPNQFANQFANQFPNKFPNQMNKRQQFNKNISPISIDINKSELDNERLIEMYKTRKFEESKAKANEGYWKKTKDFLWDNKGKIALLAGLGGAALLSMPWLATAGVVAGQMTSTPEAASDEGFLSKVGEVGSSISKAVSNVGSFAASSYNTIATVNAMNNMINNATRFDSLLDLYLKANCANDVLHGEQCQSILLAMKTGNPVEFAEARALGKIKIPLTKMAYGSGQSY